MTKKDINNASVVVGPFPISTQRIEGGITIVKADDLWIVHAIIASTLSFHNILLKSTSVV